MTSSSILPLVRKSKKRLGRGHGSGKVKTSGRGTKGQNARGKVRPGFEGGQLSIIKRLPLLRGKGKNKSQHTKAFPLSVKKLDTLSKESIITLDILKKHGMIEKDIYSVKILGKATLMNAFTVKLPCSFWAKASIEKAGGHVA
ncbi:50S ribosomal protein L15 [Candidatus Gottesmanbacteria bacterium]|nr:50S ribosomal protein L15 [Candidatus Gottesmanbacteria bacterium]